MRKTKVLFLCNVNQLRSPTAEHIYKNNDDLEVKSAGTGIGATIPVSEELLSWADIVFVMEKKQRNRVQKKFPELYKSKKIICLYIPDEYERMDPILIRILEEKLSRYIGPIQN